MKKTLLYALLFGVLSYANINAQSKDSVKTYNLDEVNVVASKQEENKEFDAVKRGLAHSNEDKLKILFTPGAISGFVSNVSSEFSLDGVMYDLTGLNFEGVRILGNRTEWQGAKPIFSNELTRTDIFNSGYSAKNSDIAGLTFVEGADNFSESSISGDFGLLERTVSYRSGEREIGDVKTGVSLYFKELDVAKVLENNVPEMKLLPTAYQGVLSANSELVLDDIILRGKIFGLSSREYNGFEQSHETELESINQSGIHLFGKADIEMESPDFRVSLFGAREYENFGTEYSYSGDNEKIKNDLGNTTLGIEYENKKLNSTIGLSSSLFRSINNKEVVDTDEYRLYVENSFVLGDFWLRPSISGNWESNHSALSYALAMSYFIDDTEIELKGGKYTTFLNPYLVREGKGVWEKSSDLPNTGKHVEAGLKFKSDLISDGGISLFYKEIDADFRGKYSRVITKGLRAFALSEDYDIFTSIFVSKPSLDGGLVPGVTEHQFQLLKWFDLGETTRLNIQFEARSGYITKNDFTNSYDRNDFGASLNLGLSQDIDILGAKFNVDVTGFNLLQPLGVTVPIGTTMTSDGQEKVHEAPAWFNVTIHGKYEL